MGSINLVRDRVEARALELRRIGVAESHVADWLNRHNCDPGRLDVHAAMARSPYLLNARRGKAVVRVVASRRKPKTKSLCQSAARHGDWAEIPHLISYLSAKFKIGPQVDTEVVGNIGNVLRFGIDWPVEPAIRANCVTQLDHVLEWNGLKHSPRTPDPAV